MLWLYVPDFRLKGMINSIAKVPERFAVFNSTTNTYDKYMWEQDPYCSGLTISD